MPGKAQTQKSYSVKDIVAAIASAKEPPKKNPIARIITELNNNLTPVFSDRLIFVVDLMDKSDALAIFGPRLNQDDGYFIIMKYKARNAEGNELRFSAKIAALSIADNYPIQLKPLVTSENISEEIKRASSDSEFLGLLRLILATDHVLRRIRKIQKNT